MRPMTHADLELVLSWRNHSDVRRYMFTSSEISPEEHSRWFERVSSDPRRHPLIFEMSNAPLGFINFAQTPTGHAADWGFYLSPEAPKGTGAYLGAAALEWAFKRIAVHKVCGQALAFNESSLRFHQSHGFRQEGVLRAQHFDGRMFHDVICFGLLVQEWGGQDCKDSHGSVA